MALKLQKRYPQTQIIIGKIKTKTTVETRKDKTVRV